MGRKKRVSTYLQAPLKKAKNIQTRRTKAATIHRDITKLSSQKSNKRLK
jgi:hypothetical protein